MLKILVADDESLIRLTVSEALRGQSHEVVAVEDGTQAIAQLSDERFDLVISDIRMPGHDGMEVFRKVQAEHAGTDVILMTGFGEVQSAVEALKAGARDYLSKPVDLDELIERVAR
ncbi:MAG: response regulator, partial [Myxococcota bacterium]